MCKQQSLLAHCSLCLFLARGLQISRFDMLWRPIDRPEKERRSDLREVIRPIPTLDSKILAFQLSVDFLSAENCEFSELQHCQSASCQALPTYRIGSGRQGNRETRECDGTC